MSRSHEWQHKLKYNPSKALLKLLKKVNLCSLNIIFYHYPLTPKIKHTEIRRVEVPRASFQLPDFSSSQPTQPIQTRTYDTTKPHNTQCISYTLPLSE